MTKISAPFVRSPYNYDAMAVSDETGLLCKDESLAQQHFADECDINRIVDTFTRTGELPNKALLPSNFGDFTDARDFHSALNSVLAAQEAFMSLSPEIRSRFGNDPARLIAFLNDEFNRPEAIKLGLVNPYSAAPPSAPQNAGAGGVAEPSQKATPEAPTGPQGGS